MSIRAIVFDIYGTLLEIGPPPADADPRWQRLFEELLQMAPPMGRLEFSVACSMAISQVHKAARAHGISSPEVYWPSIVSGIVPEFTRLSPAEQDEFLFRQIQTGHTVGMTGETADMLRWLRDRRFLLGIASNAQAYTLRELREELSDQRLGMDLFERDLCFWSYEHGFSKPDPHVFQILTARLEARGVRPAEILMVGDRTDNDIEPARAHGWQTWQLGVRADGTWTGLRERLLAPPRKATP
jgi:putative hydrolase of the HAD superfamily